MRTAVPRSLGTGSPSTLTDASHRSITGPIPGTIQSVVRWVATAMSSVAVNTLSTMVAFHSPMGVRMRSPRRTRMVRCADPLSRWRCVERESTRMDASELMSPSPRITLGARSSGGSNSVRASSWRESVRRRCREPSEWNAIMSTVPSMPSTSHSRASPSTGVAATVAGDLSVGRHCASTRCQRVGPIDRGARSWAAITPGCADPRISTMGFTLVGACGAEVHETTGPQKSRRAPAHRRRSEAVMAGITVEGDPSAARSPAAGEAGTTPW